MEGWFSPTIDSVLGVFMIFITIVSIFGNALALRIFIGLPKTRANILFTNIALSDFLTGLTSSSYVTFVLFNSRKPLFYGSSCCRKTGEVFGTISGFSHNTCSRASLYITLILSVIRCAFMCYPLRIKRYVTVPMTMTLTASVWVVALLMSSIPYMFKDTYKYQPLALLYVYSLEFLKVGTPSYILGYFFLLILPFFLPGLGIVISSLVCIPKVYRSYLAARQLTNKTKSGGRLPPDLVSLTTTVLLIVGAFLFCYTPLWTLMSCQFLVQTNVIPSSLFMHIPPYLLTIGYTVMTCLNSAINPFIFYFRGSEFKLQLALKIRMIRGKKLIKGAIKAPFNHMKGGAEEKRNSSNTNFDGIVIGKQAGNLNNHGPLCTVFSSVTNSTELKEIRV